MRRMGGLWKRIPITHATMLVGTLAIAGIPPLAGFFSKDEILGEAFLFGFGWVFLVGLITAGLTAFYMWRLMGKTFYGESRVDPAVAPRVHESPLSMTLPLIALAVPSAVVGLLVGLPLGDSVIKHWLEPVFHEAEVILALTLPEFELFGINGAIIVAGSGVAAVGLAVGIWLFGFFSLRGRPSRVESLTAHAPRLYRASLNKWYFDEINDLLFVRIGGALAAATAWFDVHVVDGTVNAVAALTQGAGREVRRVQTGRVQNYALGIALGLIGVTLLLLWLVVRA